MDNPDTESNGTPAPDERSIEERLESALTPEAEQTDDEEPKGQPKSDESDEDEESPEPEEALVEIEYDGKKVAVPKELKDAFLRQADYTTKTQQVAEERRLVAQERQLFELNRNLEAVISDDIAEFRQLQSGVRQLELAMQHAYQQNDPATLATYNAQFTMLQSQLVRKQQEIDGKKSQQAQLFAYEKQQRLQQGFEKAKAVIPGFGKETQAELLAAAKKMGYAEYELDGLDDPRAVHTLWKAAQWDKLQSAKPGVTKRAAEAPKTLKAKGLTGQGSEAKKTDDVRKQLRRSGRLEDAETAIERLLSRKR